MTTVYDATLPIFRNNIPLSATDLNKLSVAEMALHKRNQSLNFAIEQRESQPHLPLTYVTFAHRHRYLHWNGPASITVEASSPPTVANSSPLDLAPFNIGKNWPIVVKWTGTLNFVYQTPTANAVLALPSTPPTFTNGANATQLNAIVTNLDYLYDVSAGLPVTGFSARGFFNSNSNSADGRLHEHRYYHFRHAHRYLYYYVIQKTGYHPNMMEFELSYNNTVIYYQEWNNNTGEKHWVGHIDLNPLNLTKGTWYPFLLRVSKTNWDSYTDVLPVLFAETQVNTYP